MLVAFVDHNDKCE
ncbi:Protein of unknown function [Escherichia coli]|nr:Protein of unknown function [Escherichia coli]CDU39179.1 Protein of unknown function [Escherichia coli]